MKKLTEIKYVFQMMHAALTDFVLPAPLSDMDWTYIYEVCKIHRIANIAAYAIETLDSKACIPSEIRQKFFLAKQKGMAREAVQHFELEQILNAFEEERIENLPLKGSVLKQYYPSPDMRFLTDLDILYHEEQTIQVSQIMNRLGYETMYSAGCHDVHTKKPYMTVETHRSCFNKDNPFNKLMENVWQQSQKQEGRQYSYIMSWEWYYIYMIAHMAKHFQGGGIGIRMVLDLFVFEEKLQQKCDRSYIEKELQNAGLLKFEQTMRRKTREWIEDKIPLTGQDVLLDCVLYSGAYGTRKNLSGNRLLVEGTRKRKILKHWCIVIIQILFPKPESMQAMYPYLKKYPGMLPIFWIFRWIQKAVTKPIFCIRVLRDTMNRKELERMKKVTKEAGLDKGENDGIL